MQLLISVEPAGLARVTTFNCSFYAESLGKSLVNTIKVTKNPNPFSGAQRKGTQVNLFSTGRRSR